MTLQKHFLHNNLKSIEISKYRIVLGILIGVFFSIIFYLFLYLLREIFRISTVTQNYDILCLTKSEFNFYNLFIAFLSVIFGHSICLSFWFERPKRFNEKKRYRIKSIVHDQRVLNSNFLGWFSKIVLVLALLFGQVFQGGFYLFNLYAEFKFIFILIILVLYFQMWVSLRLVFKNMIFKPLIISILAVTFISVVLSKVNIVDYNMINNKILSKNIYHNYQLELPETNYGTISYQSPNHQNIYIVFQKEDKNFTKPIILYNHIEIVPDSLHEKIAQWQKYNLIFDSYRLPVQLYIHKGIKMSFINKVKQELALAQMTYISYAVIPEHPKFNTKYYQNINYKFDIRIPEIQDDTCLSGDFDNIIEIKILDKNECLLNKEQVKIENFNENIKKQLIISPNYITKLYINSNLDFESYFIFLSGIKGAINELRNEYSLKYYHKKYDMLNQDLVTKVKTLYPFYMLEINQNNSGTYPK